MKQYLFFIVAVIIAVVGLASVNIHHYLNLPEQIASSSRIYSEKFINFNFPYLHTKYDIQLADEIRGPNTVRDVNRTLQVAYYGDVVVFHLAGYGGEVESVYSILTNIRDSKAHVIMSVEAPVYSGHAYLAVNGNEIRMSNQAFLMFHTSSEMNLNCSTVEGWDRGQSNKEHCEIMKKHDMELIARMIILSDVLTPAEKVELLYGKDVYLQGQEVNRRLL